MRFLRKVPLRSVSSSATVTTEKSSDRLPAPRIPITTVKYPRRLVARHVDDFAEADCGDGDEGHVEAVEPRILAISQHHVADGAEQMHGKQHAERHIEQPDDVAGLQRF